MNTMDNEYRVVYIENPEQIVWGIIGQGVHGFNLEKAGDTGFERLCFVLQSPDDTIAGGIIGEINWGWLYVDLLWVKDELRGLGHGHRLLTSLEEEGRQRGATNAYLDTFSFQAPGFYEKHGYRVFGELPDFPPGHQRYYMTKQL